MLGFPDNAQTPNEGARGQGYKWVLWHLPGLWFGLVAEWSANLGEWSALYFWLKTHRDLALAVRSRSKQNTSVGVEVRGRAGTSSAYWDVSKYRWESGRGFWGHSVLKLERWSKSRKHPGLSAVNTTATWAALLPSGLDVRSLLHSCHLGLSTISF